MSFTRIFDYICSTIRNQNQESEMGFAWIVGQSYMILCFIFLAHIHLCDSQEQSFNTYTISSFTYGKTGLKPYDWRYIKVELPPWFSSMSLALESDVNLDLNTIRNGSISTLPIICFRQSSLPLPDVHNTSLTGLVIDYISTDNFNETQNLQNFEKCYPMQKNISLRVTNEQISSGTWYFGLFNGIGPIRTQSKMINRGSSYSFSGNISVEGCMGPTMLGQFCNQTINTLSCNENYNPATILPQNSMNLIFCRNSNGIVCHEKEPNIYSVDVIGIVEELIITVSNVTFNQTQSSNITMSFNLMAYARHEAIPFRSMYDFSGDISKAPLVMNFPIAGRWYITVQPIDISNNSLNVCYLLEGQVFQCPVDKAGLNCTSEKYMLQTFLRRNPGMPFESNYLPISGKNLQETPLGSSNFPLEPFLTNFSIGQTDAWTYFLMDVPFGGIGGNIHVHLKSDTSINYQIYARYGSLPSSSIWDYFYANGTNNSKDSMFFKSYGSSEHEISFYILYPKVGTWCIGSRQVNPVSSTSQTAVSLSLERCPQKCSSHGSCKMQFDTSGLISYSYCDCDRNHGGFDCSIELVTRRGHVRQSIFLIASNVAAVLPAYWALRNKAFAEWVLFTSSGISSALYHACDVGTWCVMSFHILQFLDFWLSFMAVVSTFVYLSTISENSKRTIHTVVAIVTALMAETGPTRSSNIGYVIGIGTAGLLLAWLIEFCTKYRSFSFSTEFHLNLVNRWETIKQSINNIIKTIRKRFRWGFILAGFIALGLAATSWTLESTKNYWIWHSMWHVSIYTCSFLFLCSKAAEVSPLCENERSSDQAYELTRQNSFGGGELRV